MAKIDSGKVAHGGVALYETGNIEIIGKKNRLYAVWREKTCATV